MCGKLVLLLSLYYKDQGAVTGVYLSHLFILFDDVNEMDLIAFCLETWCEYRYTVS